jgi:acyl dehydratase
MTTTLEPGTVLIDYPVGEITRDRMVAVMEVMGDLNPIHEDEELARRLGFRGIVNQGPANLAYVVNMLMDRLGVDAGQVKLLDFRFHDNVVPGDALIARGEITALRDKGQVTEVDCSFRLDMAGGAPRLSGTATIEVPRARP